MGESADTYRCSLTPGDAAGRIDADRALAARVVGTERHRDGLRVVFADGPDTRRLVDTFVANERRCCGFFDLAVSGSGGRITLEITAPPTPSAQRLVDDAKRAFDLGPDAVGPPGGGAGERS